MISSAQAVFAYDYNEDIGKNFITDESILYLTKETTAGEIEYFSERIVIFDGKKVIFLPMIT